LTNLCKLFEDKIEGSYSVLPDPITQEVRDGFDGRKRAHTGHGRGEITPRRFADVTLIHCY